MNNLYMIEATVKLSVPRRAWMGGDTPPADEARRNPIFRALRRAFFREQISDLGYLGLRFGLSHARIFWNRARLDAWRTWTESAISVPSIPRPADIIATPALWGADLD